MPFREIKGAKYCEFKKGDILIDEGEVVKYVYYIIDGIVEVLHYDIYGNKEKVELRKENNSLESLVGILELYREDSCATKNIFIARSDIKAYKISSDEYKKWAHEHNDILEETIKFFIKTNSYLREKEKRRKTKSISILVCKELLSYAKVFNNQYIIPKEYKFIDIANKIGIHKSTMAKIIRVLKEEGILEKTPYGMLITNKTKLEEYTKYDFSYQEKCTKDKL